MTDLPLHNVHATQGARFGPWHASTVPLDYGDWRREHGWLRATAGLSDVSAHGRLSATGPDIAQVLQGVVTNEVKHLPAGSGCLAVLLNDVGRARTLLEILRTEDGYLMETPPGLAEASQGYVDYYIITEDAVVEDTSASWAQLTVQGPRSREALTRVVGATALPDLDAPEHAHTRGDIEGVGAVRIVRRTRTGEDGYDVWIPAAHAEAGWRALAAAVDAVGGGAVGIDALEAARVEAGIVQFGDDLDDSVIPLEANLMHAISENKGCYLGQEVIARIINLSKPVRRLVGLLPDAEVRAGDVLVHDGRDVGRITSAVRSPLLDRPLALGYLRTELLARGVNEVTIRPRGDEATRAETKAQVRTEPVHRSSQAPVAVVPPSPTAPKMFGGPSLL